MRKCARHRSAELDRCHLSHRDVFAAESAECDNVIPTRVLVQDPRAVPVVRGQAVGGDGGAAVPARGHSPAAGRRVVVTGADRAAAVVAAHRLLRGQPRSGAEPSSEISDGIEIVRDAWPGEVWAKRAFWESSNLLRAMCGARGFYFRRNHPSEHPIRACTSGVGRGFG